MNVHETVIDMRMRLFQRLFISQFLRVLILISGIIKYLIRCFKTLGIKINSEEWFKEDGMAEDEISQRLKIFQMSI